MSDSDQAAAPGSVDASAPTPPVPDATPADRRRWTLVALAVFALATLFLFRGLLGRDWRDVVPANVVTEISESQGQGDWSSLAETDLRFVVWLVSRNAWTFVHRPLDLYDAEQCHPAERALTFGEPGIALGLLALPLRLLIGDPVATFDATLIVLTLLAALAMFLLVREWTGSPPAGIVAGLLYAFHMFKIGDVVHVIVWDGTWTVFALYFVTRLFRGGRNRDAIGLAACVTMQLGGSLYPLACAALIGAPFLVYLVVKDGVRTAGIARLVGLGIFVAASGALLLRPYLMASGAGEIEQSPFQGYASIAYLLPGGDGFFGWVGVGLAAAALALARRRDVPGAPGDLRWILLGIALLLISVSVVGEGTPGQRTVAVVRGEPIPTGFPNLYLLLARLLPGLDLLRGPGALYGGVHLVLCLLAGLGVAAVLRRMPGRRTALAAGVIIVLAALDVLRPPALGLTPAFELRPFSIGPDPAALALFAELESKGDTGPLLEYPMNRFHLLRSSQGVLLTSYHHRRTAYCYNSFIPAQTEEVERLSGQLPADEPLARLHAMGFRTLVVHHEPDVWARDQHRRRFEVYSRGEGAGRLQPLAANDSLSAYRILP